MDLFTQPENLSEGDSWRCPRCKKPVEATKQMSLWKLPPVLIVQLKRFSFKYVLYSDKIDKFVQYPISGFDVSQHIAVEGGDGGSNMYDLYGVVNHMGRLLGGHYTAYARTMERETAEEIDWRLFDDSRVSEVMEDSVVNDQAYLLLYRRRDAPFALPPAVPNIAATTQEDLLINNSNTPILDQRDNRLVNNTTTIPVGGATTRTYPTLSLPSSSSPIITAPYHVTTINTMNNLFEDNNSPDEGPVINNSNCYRATSMINTNDAVCGNLVSDIVIEDGAVSGCVPCPDDAALPECGSVGGGQMTCPTFAMSPSSNTFNCDSASDEGFNSSLQSVFGSSSGSGGGGSSNNVFTAPFLPGPSVFGGSVSGGTSESGVLDEVTPMSVSSASQPSLSSTEEESVSTAQEELD